MAEGARLLNLTSLIGDSLRYYPDLLKFRFVDAKEFRHLDDLIRTYKIRRLSAESIYTGSKVAALHCLRDIQTKAASALLGAKQAEVANNHFISPPAAFESHE